MKIVVTGALGHIGSRVIRDIPVSFPDAEIVMIDNIATQRYFSLYNLPSANNYQFVEEDVLEIDLLKFIDGADVVIHLAAITDAAGSFEIKERVEHVNYNATVRVADACSQARCSMIHLSSTSIYGTQKEVVDEACSSEELKPQSPYAETKLREEQYLESLALSKGLSFVICRFGTICGVSPGMRFHTAVNKFCWQAVMGQPLTVWRTALHQKRPYLTLDEAMAAISFIIKNKLFDQRVYNVLTENLTVNSIIQHIREHISDIDIQYVDTAIMNQLSYEVLNTRFKERGFIFSGSIKKSIAETIALIKQAGGHHDQ